MVVSKCVNLFGRIAFFDLRIQWKRKAAKLMHMRRVTRIAVSGHWSSMSSIQSSGNDQKSKEPERKREQAACCIISKKAPQFASLHLWTGKHDKAGQ